MTQFDDNSFFPRNLALQTVNGYKVPDSSSVSYFSTGKVLLIGQAAQVERAIEGLNESLDTFALLTTTCPKAFVEFLKLASVPVVSAASNIAVEGYLGGFQVSASVALRTISINSLFLDATQSFDLVLDFQPFPALKREVQPIGYFAKPATPEDEQQVFSECNELVGHFDKPVYFKYERSICAHDKSGIPGCRQCIEACPAEAITTQDQQIEVNPFLCQGCGDCSTVCPAGAINYLYPQRSDTLNRIRLLITSYTQQGGSTPVILLHSDEDQTWVTKNQHTIAATILPYSLESLSSAGMEIWISSIAFGATSVKLLRRDDLCESSKTTLQFQLSLARELLVGSGMDGTCVDWITKTELLTGQDCALSSPISTVARFAGIEDKRTALRLAVDHLCKHNEIKNHAIPLGNGAPFGQLKVNVDTCTLCMACVSICPEGALNDGFDRPQLKFIEANCVQCGMCVNACPEEAIDLSTRYLLDWAKAKQASVLHEQAPIQCIQCGKPFASEKMIAAISAKLANHPMFQGENKKKLRMCDECKIQSIFNG